MKKLSARVYLCLLPAVAMAWLVVGGCAVVPAKQLPVADRDGALMREVMARKDTIVHLSPDSDSSKPPLLLLHGATDDPTEMMDIAAKCSTTYNVFLYSFNFHEPLEKAAAGLIREMQRLKSERHFKKDFTVVVYSYSAVVFRAAVVFARDEDLFAGMTLVQLVPTAGGSFGARWMYNRTLAFLVSLASKPSVAENPYGPLATALWGGEGDRKFYRAIDRGSVYSILLEDDEHSLARINDPLIRERYVKALGSNVIMLPSTPGLTHGEFVSHPIVIERVRQLLEESARRDFAGTTNRDVGQGGARLSGLGL